MLSLIPLFPFIGFLINACLGKRLSKSVSGGLASVAMLASFAVSAVAVWRLAAMNVVEGATGLQGPAMEGGTLVPPLREINETVFNWIASGDLSVDLAFRLDPLSAVMILIITGIGSLIHIYSTAYMHEETDSEYARFFSYLNLFVFFMLLLVLGSNILVMFIGWEGVGLCSYLLIGYYYQKKSASDAANKAFIVNRVGDYAFILGSLLIFVTLGTFDFKEIAVRVAALPPEATFGTLSLITLLLFIGATGKSAQIPLYVWLPDAMEGPTPVSALIHAATMVTAGVYMIGRNAVLFEHAPITLTIVAIVGAATALMAGTIGLVQNDIKRVLAYSTVSQLGYMFLAMGVGAFGAGIFHLYTHAFFKALLFLGSGAVIHALHGEQDIRNMGGLKKHIPITYWTFIVGSIAIAGIPPLAGFFSKDEILFETFYRGHQWLWAIGLLTSFLTAVYMWRLVHLTFHGQERFDAHAIGPHTPDLHDAPEPAHTHGGSLHGARPATHGHAALAHAGRHLHDAPPAMAIALVILALGSVLAGFSGIPHALGGHNALGTWLEPVFEAHAARGEGAEGAWGAGGAGGAEVALTALAVGDCAPGNGAEGAEGAAGAMTGLSIGDCAPGTDVARASNVQTAAQPPEGQPAGGARTSQTEAAAGEHEKEVLELTLMAVSVAVAALGLGLAWMIWLKRPEVAERTAARFPGLHRVLLNKYYVDELYDVTVVQPVRIVSEDGLWRGMDARVIDGAVNATGQVVGGFSAVLRLAQNGSVKTYAASTFMGVVMILAYYLWR